MKKLMRFFLVIYALSCPLSQRLYAQETACEKILYLISPVGRAEYEDMGMVDMEGKKVKLIIFKSQVLWLDDTEKIYADPLTMLPLRIERDVSTFFGREFIVEDYDQNNFSMTTTKFQNNKKISEQTIRADGPIHNAILLTFYPRLQPKLDIGWSFQARIPIQFEVKLTSLEEVVVPAGKFKSYHFTSNPDKFELWVSQDNPRIPVKIKGSGGLGYSLVMKEYSAINNRELK